MEPSTLIYCAKCQTHTPSQDVQVTYTSNHRPMMNGQCTVCGTRKNTFIKMKTRKGDDVSGSCSE